MDSFAIVLLLIGSAIGILLGLIAGFILWGGTSGEKSEPEKSKEPGLKGHIEILKLWRNETTGAIVPEINNIPIQTASVLDESQRAQVVKIFTDFYKWSQDSESSKGKQVKPHPSNSTSSQIVSSQNVSIPSAVSGETSKDPAYKPSPTPFADSLPEPVSLKDALRSNPFKRPKVKKEEDEAPKTIADQIDQILQKRIENTPLANRGISVRTLPTGGISIIVGKNQFESVDDVTDHDAKAALKAAVDEWSKRQRLDSQPPQ